MKIKLISLLLVFPFFITGCIRNFNPTEPSQNFNNKLIFKLNEYLWNQQIRYYCLANNQVYILKIKPSIPSDQVDLSKDKLPYTGECKQSESVESAEKSSLAAKAVRNEIIEQGILVIDANYAQYIRDFNLGRSTGNFFADTIELGTSGAIGIIKGPAKTLSILGIALSTFKGGRSSFELNYFNKQTTTILVNQMDTNRRNAYAAIYQKRNKPIIDYPLPEAIKDLVAYYNEGTLVRAFTALSQQTAINSQTSANAVLNAQGLPTSDSLVVMQSLSEAASLTLYRLNGSVESDIAKLKKILYELEKNFEFKMNLTQFNISSDNANGQQIKFVLQNIRDNAKSANNITLFNIINQAIVDHGN